MPESITDRIAEIYATESAGRLGSYCMIPVMTSWTAARPSFRVVGMLS